MSDQEESHVEEGAQEAVAGSASDAATEGTTSTVLDELIQLTSLKPEEEAGVRGAFDHIIQQFKGKEAVTALDKVFLDDIIATIDETLSKQIAAVMKHPTFKAVESSWRGLQFTVQRTDFSKNIQIDVVQASKKEILEDLQKDSLNESHFFNFAYSQCYDIAGGKPYGAIIGDFEFDSGGQDMDLLSRISEVAEACHAPFISSVGPSFFNCDSWKEFLDIPNLTPWLEQKEFAMWTGLRQKESSRYVGLTMPRFLLREAYGPNGIQTDAFNFTEGAENASDYLWGNACYAYASKVNQAFADDGWIVRVSGGKNAGGAVRDLMVTNYEIGTEEVKIPTEMAIDDAQEKEFADNGIMAMVGYKNENVAAFFGCNSIQKPKVLSDAKATANARLGAMLPYIFPVSRVAHYLKSIQRDNIGSFASPAALQKELETWIRQYYSEMDSLPQDKAARFPFKGYQVKVVENPAKPGWFSVDIWVEPRIVIQGIEGSLHLVTEVPNKA